MAIYKKARHFRSEVQIGAMKSHYPQFKAIRKGKNLIEFIGELQPKEELPVYTVSILYRGNADPQVRILSPKLVENPKHFYKQSGTLCLYHPRDFKWKKYKLISKYIVPLTSAWIYFYEVWLEKDIWYGPEAEHETPKETSND